MTWALRTEGLCLFNRSELIARIQGVNPLKPAVTQSVRFLYKIRSYRF